MAAGGTELAYGQLSKRVPKELLDSVQIVYRPTEIVKEKPSVLWVHDMPGDVPFLGDRRQQKEFSAIVFVSSWQQTVFNINMGIAFSDSHVIRNAIEPIHEVKKSSDGTIRLIYHPTPHRGLEILIPVFIDLCAKYDNLHLDVFSNFDIYGWPENNKHFEHIYQMCRDHPNITYHGTQSNETVRDYLRHAHIFAYPCIWRETSCMSAMEAMSAECLIVAPDYAALPETLANYNVRYCWHENPQIHALRFRESLISAIDKINSDETKHLLSSQKEFADRFYSWDTRAPEWIDFLSNVSVKKKSRGSINWMER